MSSTMEWIRRTYDVPARHRMRIEYDGKPAIITGASNAGLVLRVEGERYKVYTHPCYRIIYPAVPEPARPRGWCKHCGKDRAMKDGVMGVHRWNGRDWSKPCPGSGKPPWKPVRNLTHPGEQRAVAAS
ncbi:hypothetical protein [Streptomyces galilaeus]|uniref:hypothetical protein n=1 Tax=Streptomyces galilaeus TaxID=33899 RepID=UPI0038F76409